MKKKQVFALLLAGSIVFTGWGIHADAAPAGAAENESTAAEQPASDAGGEGETAEKMTAENATESAAESGTAANAAEAAAGGYVIDGGDPWIDSNLKENVVNAGRLSEKDDFSEAVNYDWVMENEIPEGYGSWDEIYNVEKIVEDKAIAALEDQELTGRDAELARTLYQAFLDWEERDRVGLAPMESLVKDIDSLQDVSALTAFLCDRDRSALVHKPVAIGNTQDLTDSTRYVVDMDYTKPLLEDAAEYETLSTVGRLKKDAYQKLFTSIMVRMGYSEEQAQEYYDANMSYEAAVAEACYTAVEKGSPDFYSKILNYYGLPEIEKLSPNFPVEAFVNAYGYGDARVYIVTEPDALAKVSELYTEDHLDDIKGYMIVRTVISLAGTLDRTAFNDSILADNAINGSTGMLTDQQYAYREVHSALHEPLEKAYMQKYDPSEAKKVITQLCRDVVAVYKDLLNGAEWLSAETKDYAIQKLDAISLNVIAPEEYLDYSSLSLDNLSYFEMMKALEEYDWKRNLELTNGTVNKKLWENSTLEANASYLPTANSINIYLGILDGLVYSDDMSREQLYAGIGSVIGHEISHAFDTKGSQFDKNGDFRNWWTDEDLTAFQARAQKLVDYYNNITAFGDEKVIGEIVQGEAIADMAGLKAMLLLAEKEDNFDYRKFFESYARVWRATNSYESDYAQLKQNPHPLNYLRVNVVVQQFDEFYDAFGIKEGDGMYLAPDDRILVW